MTTDDKIKAAKIIMASHSPKVSFNVPVENHISNVYDILIHESNATLLNELIAAGYSLHMTAKGLAVNKY